MEYPIVFGIALVAAGGSVVACGLYAIRNSYSTPINRVFLALGIAMLLWCLGLAITVVAANEEICALGRRLAPLGWGPICSLLLHFVLLLTQKHAWLKKRGMYVLLYLPAAVTVFAFTYLPLIGRNRDTLLHNRLGWLNISSTDFWDWFYYGYAFLFSVTAILLIFAWARSSASDNIKKQGKLLIVSLLLAAVCGSLTDILPIFLQIRTPQFSPVFVLLPIAAVSYSVRRHGFMRPEMSNRNELILNESSYTNVYRYIALIFLVAGILNPLTQILLPHTVFLPSDWLFSLILMAVAGLIFLLNRIDADDGIKEMLFAVGFSVIIPTVTMRFALTGSITIWAFVFLLIITLLLFNRHTVMSTVIVSSALAQVMLWAAVPTAVLRVNGVDYLLRIFLIVLAAIVAGQVHRIYVQRLKDNANQIGMQMLVAEISHDFVSVNEQNFNAKMYGALKRCGLFIGSDDAHVVLFSADAQRSYYTCAWPDAATQRESGAELDADLQALLLQRFEVCNTVRLYDTALLPPTECFKQQLDNCNIRALLALPIKKRGAIIGVLCFTASAPMEKWREESFTYLEIIANIIVDAVTKVDAEREINFIAYHDQLTLLPNRILFRDKLERRIKRAESGGTVFAVAFLDIDSFKTINDTMGHEWGDRLIFEAARILSRNIRSSDMIARFGGDEFVVLFNDVTGTESLIKIMDKMMQAFRQPILLSGREFTISISVGVALYPQDGLDFKTLIQNADTAMYTAKMRGKAQYFLYSQNA